MASLPKGEEMNYSCMDDCIHLRACRRIMKIAKSKGYVFSRSCNNECTAYESESDYQSRLELYSYDDVMKAINGACEDGQNGYYPGDLLVSDYV